MAWREPFEAYMEAAIVFGRVAIARFKKAAEKKARSDPELKAAVKEWWDSLKGDPAIEFFKEERDFIVHERPPVVGQNLYGPGVPHPQKAEGFYFYETETPDTPVTDTIERHLNSVEKLVSQRVAMMVRRVG